MTVLARTHPLRLTPGTDLHAALCRFAARPGRPACVVVAGLGSLDGARVRPAGRDDALRIDGDLEIIALSGTLARDGIHVHLAVADAGGRVTGGHLLRGCRIRTTAELLLAELEGARFLRRRDALTGHRELQVRRAPRRRRGA
ncbi:MAG TPA: PPC domain-containing DNA-binding protein [Pseudomonadales bacterium]|nr:PPC domain-containing DNA-binding protein [Pseudomonadales bacterium]